MTRPVSEFINNNNILFLLGPYKYDWKLFWCVHKCYLLCYVPVDRGGSPITLLYGDRLHVHTRTIYTTLNDPWLVGIPGSTTRQTRLGYTKQYCVCVVLRSVSRPAYKGTM